MGTQFSFRGLKALLCLCGTLFTASLLAEPFVITDRVGFNGAMNTAADAIEAEINTGFMAPTNRSGFLEASAKAATSGTSTLLADRASRPSLFSVSVGGQATYQGDLTDLSGAGTNQLPPVGVGGQASVLIGIPGSNLGIKRLSRMTFFLSGGGANVAQEGVRFQMFNLGLNASYQLVPEVGAAILGRWGGIRVLSGLNYANAELSYGGKVTANSGSLAVDMDVDLRLKTSNFWMPFEVSTSLQLFYLFNVYGGGAVDVNIGSANFAGISTGPVVTGLGGSSASAQLNLDDGTSAKTDFATARAFVGAQFSLWMVRVGAEYTVKSNSAKAVGAYVKLAL